MSRQVPPDDLPFTQKLISAMSGSLVMSLLVTPLDVVRIRWQAQEVSSLSPVDINRLAVTPKSLSSSSLVAASDIGISSCCRKVFLASNTEACLISRSAAVTLSTSNPIDCAVHEFQQRHFTSTLDGLQKIARNEGFFSLWKGLSPTLLMGIPSNVIYYSGYDWLRSNPDSPLVRTIPDDYVSVLAGSGARLLAATAVSPIELFRTRLQATSGASQSSSHVLDTLRGVQDMVSLRGYHSLWRGLTLTLWRDVPFSGVYWFTYENIRAKLTHFRERWRGHFVDSSDVVGRRRAQNICNNSEVFIDSFSAGALSGSLASMITMPFDVGKTRTQVYNNSKSLTAPTTHGIANVAPEERSMLRLLAHIFRTEGIQGLWKGWLPRVLKVAPACAIMISSYEISKKVFRTSRASLPSPAPPNSVSGTTPRNSSASSSF